MEFRLDGVVERIYVFNNIVWGNTATTNGADVFIGARAHAGSSHTTMRIISMAVGRFPRTTLIRTKFSQFIRRRRANRRAWTQEAALRGGCPALTSYRRQQ